MTKDLQTDKTIIVSKDADRQREKIGVLTVLNGQCAGQQIAIDNQHNTLGRGKDADKVILDPTISRVHAKIEKIGDNYYIFDLRSTNGTFVNNTLVNNHKLNEGDKIRLGETLVLEFTITNEPITASPSFTVPFATAPINDSNQTVRAAVSKEQPNALAQAISKTMPPQGDSLAFGGILTQQQFDEKLQEEVRTSIHTAKVFSILLFSVDNIENIRGQFGSPAEDFTVKKVAVGIRNLLRKADTIGNYQEGMYGIILFGVDEQKSYSFADKVRKAIANYKFVHQSNQIPVTISVGLSTQRDGQFDSADGMIKEAVAFLNLARSEGGNQVKSSFHFI